MRLCRDALITCVVNTCTCLTAGVLVFAILGYMAHLQGSTVQEVARSGPGLVFLTYPELVLSLPISFFWAIIFFAMLLVSIAYIQGLSQIQVNPNLVYLTILITLYFSSNWTSSFLPDDQDLILMYW